MSLQDLTLNEVTCCECHKPISTIPTWLAGSRVRFECEDCRQKRPPIPGINDVDIHRGIDAVEEFSPIIEAVEDAVDDELDDELEESEDFAE